MVELKLCECGCGEPAPIASKRGRGYVKGEPMRFVNGHNRRGVRTAGAWQQRRGWRRWREADRGHGAGPCWIWLGYVTAEGYGTAQNPETGKMVNAHRAIWIERRGSIPPELELDHLCGCRDCVNPDHLEPVTRAEHMRRHCEAEKRFREHVEAMVEIAKRAPVPDGDGAACWPQRW